jgi:hypothetical protein
VIGARGHRLSLFDDDDVRATVAPTLLVHLVIVHGVDDLAGAEPLRLHGCSCGRMHTP